MFWEVALSAAFLVIGASAAELRPITDDVIITANDFLRRGKFAATYDVPPPVIVKSSMLTMDSDEDSSRKGRVMEIGNDGVPVIHGMRSPDSPDDDLRVYRNARIVNNKLVTDWENAVEPQKLPAVPNSVQVHAYTGFLPSGHFQQGLRKYPPFYYRDFYGRSPRALDSSEHIVSSSYATGSIGNQAPKQSRSNDVIYGSGWAAEPSISQVNRIARLQEEPPVAQKYDHRTAKLQEEQVTSKPTSSSSSAKINFKRNFPPLQNARIVDPGPQEFAIRDVRYQSRPDAPSFQVPIPVLVPRETSPNNHFNSWTNQPYVNSGWLPVRRQTSSPSVYQSIMEPIRRMRHHIYEMAAPVVGSVMNAGRQVASHIRGIQKRSLVDPTQEFLNQILEEQGGPYAGCIKRYFCDTVTSRSSKNELPFAHLEQMLNSSVDKMGLQSNDFKYLKAAIDDILEGISRSDCLKFDCSNNSETA